MIVSLSLRRLGIGSWDGVCTIHKDTPLIEAMKTFLAKRVSALPLLNADGRVVDIYAKFDAINLAADKTYNDLDATVFDALSHRSDVRYFLTIKFLIVFSSSIFYPFFIGHSVSFYIILDWCIFYVLNLRHFRNQDFLVKKDK